MKKILLLASVALFVSSVTMSCKDKHCQAYNSAKVEKVKKDQSEREL